MSATQLTSCKGSSHRNCHMNLPLKPVTKDSCILALFANNRDSIQSYCNFRFVHDVIVSKIMELDSNKILLYDSSILSMECNGKHQMVHGCNFCIFDLPCECSLGSPDFYLPPRLISCKNTSKEDITRLHPVNLILLQQFFSDDKFQHIFADTTFLTPLNVSVPNFKLYNHQMSHILADDEKNHLNLTTMVEIAKNDDIVFQTLAEPILDGQIAIQSDWPDFNGILILVALSFAAATTILLFWLFFKVRKMAALLLILQQSHKVKALQTTLPSFIYTHPPESVSISYFDLNITLSWEHANFILLLLNTALLLVLVVKCIKVRKVPMLLLEVTSMDQCIFVPVMKLPLCPTLTTINIPETVTTISLCGSKLLPKLKLNWADFTIEDQLTENVYHVPTHVNLSIWQSYKLSQILKKPFFINLHTEHNGYLSPISLSQL